jgi:hypothetical protein
MDQSVHEETRLSVGRLADALTRLGDALAAGDLEGVLAAEPQLAHLTSALATRPAPIPDNDVLRSVLLEARLALRRCERLGAGLTTFIECSRAAQGLGTQYVRQGLARVPAGGRALTARG